MTFRFDSYRPQSTRLAKSPSARAALLVRLLVGFALALSLGCAQPNYVELYPYQSDIAVSFQSQDEVEAAVIRVPVPRDDRVKRLVKLFRDAGCKDTNLRSENVQGSKTPNVICTLPGKSDKTIVVGAHHVSATGGKGIYDAWMAVSLLPSLYASIAAQEHEHTYEFIAFSSNYLRGDASYEYLNRVPERKDEIVAMVWLDFLGLGPISAWTERTDPNLFADFVSAAHAISVPVEGLNLHGVGSIHDHSRAFRWFDIPTIYLHSFDEESAGLLTNRNFDSSMKHLDRDAYFESYRVLAVYLGYLDRSLEARQL